ncbi:MAG: hypothetical protein IJZ35_07410 [Clostridia bacterium]|nr:hypothetical protein [Clostridia bacterium]
MKKFSAIMLIMSIMLVFTACSEDKTGSVNFGDYNPEIESTTIYNNSDLLYSDTNWINAYALKYNYYDKSTGESIITEGKCGNYYQSHDSASNVISYYAQQEGYILQYFLNKDTKTGTVSVVTDGTMDDLYSGFSLISTCDPYFPVYKNVTKVGQDFVADRSATRYKQTQTENGIVTKIAYVWIDDELGFASKCEQYNALTEELEMRWELLDFTQNVKESDIMIDIDSYEIAG